MHTTPGDFFLALQLPICTGIQWRNRVRAYTIVGIVENCSVGDIFGQSALWSGR